MAPRRTDTNRLNEALKLVPSYLGQAGLWDRFYRDAYLQVAAAASAAVAKSPVPAVEPAYARGLLEMAEREHGGRGDPRPVDAVALESLRWLIRRAGVDV